MEKTTPHYAHPTGLALSITAGVLYLACAALIAIWPDGALWLFNDWFHGIDLSRMSTTTQIGIGSLIRGLFTLMLSAYLTGALFGWLYNLCLYHCIRWGWVKPH